MSTPESFSVHTPLGAAHIVTRQQIESCPAWSRCFSGHRQDHRYYRIVEDTIRQDFEYRYVVLEDLLCSPRAIQPVFLVNQDILEGSGRFLRAMAGLIRAVFPRFMFIRTLMIGCVAGEGHLGLIEADGGASLFQGDSATWVGRILGLVLRPCAKRLGASLVVLKEFSHLHRPALIPLAEHGFTRVPSFPMTRLGLNYRDFEHYMTAALSRNARKSLRRNLREAQAAGPIELQIVEDVTPWVDEVYPLYLQVYDRATLRFEKLTKEYLCRIGREMPERVRFFIWRQAGRAVALSICMIHDDTIYDMYLGMEYPLALDLHLYFHTIRDTLAWAMARGFRWYVSTALGYAPKLQLGCHLVPLDLYVRHTSPLFNVFMRRMLPILEPTRHDKTLRAFPNWKDLWDPLPMKETPAIEAVGDGAPAALRTVGPNSNPSEADVGHRAPPGADVEVSARPGVAAPPMGRWFLNPYLQIALGALLVAASELLLKKGASVAARWPGAVSWTGIAALGSIWTWGGILTYILSFASWLYVLKYVPLGIAFTLVNSVQILVPVGAWLFLGEPVSPTRWAGIALVAAGILLLVRPAAAAETRL